MSQKISVIIPVYNIENFLEKCINSIISQSYSNIEIILIDDGSTDRSSEICDYYASNDRRIKVVHKKNKGLSSARNIGLDIATGTLISFVDGDDYIHRMMLENLYKHKINHMADIVTCNYLNVYKYSKPIIQNNNNMPLAESVYSTEEALEDLLYEKNTTNTACAKLYDAKLFNNIRYPIGFKYEDLATTYKLFSCLHSLMLLI